MQPIAAPKAKQAVREAEPWIQKLARLGYAAKGVVYALIGVLAFMPLIGEGGKATNERGAIDQIARQPFGTFLLVAIGIGLLGYAIWRIIMAIYNPEHKNAIKRVAYIVTGIGYGTLGVLSLRAVTGDRASNGNPDQGQVGITAELLQQPFGKLLVFVLAAIIFAVSIAQLVNGATAKFKEILRLDQMNEGERSFAILMGRIGLISRGIVFLVISWFIAKAATAHDPQKAKGFAGALKEIAEAPYGVWLFGSVALGLIAYGAFMFVMAKYRRMTPVQ